MPAKLASAAYNQETNLLTVTFDKPVTLEATPVLSVDDADEASSFTVAKNTAVDAEGKAITDFTKASATWTFNVPNLETGLTTANLKAYIVAGAVKNEAGVANVAGQETYAKGIKVEYTADEVKPTVVGAVFNNNTNTLTLEFSEKVSTKTADTVAASIELYEANGTALTGFTSLTGLTPDEDTTTTVGSSKVFTYDVSTKVSDLEKAFNTGKDVKVVVKDNAFKDEANLGNVKSTYATGISVEYKDYMAPFLGPVTAPNKNLVVVSFTEPVDETFATNVENYSITLPNGTPLAINSVTLQPVKADGTQEVYLTTADQETGALYNVTVSNITDKAGNKAATAFPTPFNGSTTTDVEAVSVDAVTPLAPINAANDTLTIKFNTAVDASALNIANYTVLQSDKNDFTTAEPSVKEVSLAGAKVEVVDADTVKITLGTANLQNNKYYKVIASDITSVTGKTLGTTNAVSAQLTGVTALTASIKSQSNNKDASVVLEFDQELDKTAAETVANYTISTGETVNKATYAWNAETKKATVTLATTAALTATADVTLDAKVVSLAGTSIADPSTALTKPAALVDNIAPTITKVEKYVGPTIEDDKIEITFAENDLLDASAKLATNYIVNVDGTVVDSKFYTVAHNTGVVEIQFNLKDDNAYNLQAASTVTVTAKDVLDKAGNKLVEVTKTATDKAGTDKDAPTITTLAADASGDYFTVTFDNEVNADFASELSNIVIENSVDSGATWTKLTPILAETADNKVFKVYVSNDVTAEATTNRYRVTVTNVEDLAGNKVVEAGITKDAGSY